MNVENEKQIYLDSMQDPFYDTTKIPDYLKDDKYFLLTAYKRNHPCMLSIASDRLKDDKEFVLHVCKTYNEYLLSVSDRLKDDKEVVLTCLKTNGDWLEHASDRLKDDIEVVIASLENTNYSTDFASDRIKNILKDSLDFDKNSKVEILKAYLETENTSTSVKKPKL